MATVNDAVELDEVTDIMAGLKSFVSKMKARQDESMKGMRDLTSNSLQDAVWLEEEACWGTARDADVGAKRCLWDS